MANFWKCAFFSPQTLGSKKSYLFGGCRLSLKTWWWEVCCWCLFAGCKGDDGELSVVAEEMPVEELGLVIDCCIGEGRVPKSWVIIGEIENHLCKYLDDNIVDYFQNSKFLRSCTNKMKIRVWIFLDLFIHGRCKSMNVYSYAKWRLYPY